MTISVIIGSTRQGRFSEKPAQWVFQQLRKREPIEGRLLDLRDFPLPFFDQPMPPAMPGRAFSEVDLFNFTRQKTPQATMQEGLAPGELTDGHGNIAAGTNRRSDRSMAAVTVPVDEIEP